MPTLVGGPEGNRTPDLIHAKNESGGRPFSAFFADFDFCHYRSPIGGLLVAEGQFSPNFACQASEDEP